MRLPYSPMPASPKIHDHLTWLGYLQPDGHMILLPSQELTNLHS